MHPERPGAGEEEAATDPADAGWAGLGLFFAANVLFAAGLYSHAFLYNFYLEALAHPESVMGLAAAALTAGGLAALFPSGVAVDRLGPRPTFLLAAGLALSGLAAGAFVVSPAGIYAVAFVAGAGAAAWRVSMGPIMMRLASPSRRARAFTWNVALLVASGAVWTAAAGALPAWLERVFGWSGLGGIRGALLLGAIGTAVSAAVFLLVPAAGRRQPAKGDPPRVEGLAGLRIPAAVAILVAVVALWMLGSALVLPFFNLYFLRVHELSVARIGGIFAVANVLTAVTLFGAGFLASRLGPRRALLAWTLVFPAALWLLAGTSWLPLALGAYLIQGMVPPATNPLIDQILLEEVPSERHGAVSSWRNAATEGGGLVGASTGGWLLQNASFPVLFVVAGGVALLGALGLAVRLGWRRASKAVVG